MNATEAVSRAVEEPTLAKALSWICVWECERAIRQAKSNPQWETCFEYCIKAVMEAWAARSTIAAPAPQIDVDDPECADIIEVALRSGFDYDGMGSFACNSNEIVAFGRAMKELGAPPDAAPVSTAAPVVPVEAQPQKLEEPQVMGRVHNDRGQGEAWLNSVGRQLPDNAPLYAAPAAQSQEVWQAIELGKEVARLQDALAFWLPNVPTDESVPKEVADRIANDAFLLIGTDGNLPDDFKSAEELGWISLSAAQPVQDKPQDDEQNAVQLERELAAVKTLIAEQNKLAKERQEWALHTSEIISGLKGRIAELEASHPAQAAPAVPEWWHEMQGTLVAMESWEHNRDVQWGDDWMLKIPESLFKRIRKAMLAAAPKPDA